MISRVHEIWWGNSVSYRIFYEYLAFPILSYNRISPKLKAIYIASSRPQAAVERSSALFSIPSLRKVVWLQDPGTYWVQRYHCNRCFVDIDDYTHIKTFDLQRTGITPRGVCNFCTVFPALQNLSITNDRAWTHVLYVEERREVVEKMDISSSLARMTDLTQLSLNYHTHFGEDNQNVPPAQALGPSGGITGLENLENLTKLTIGMHLLMRCINPVATGSLSASPLSPGVLPKSLRELQLYTCFSCWSHEDAEPAESTITFLEDLDRKADRFPHLEQVLYFCETPWWVGYHMEPGDSHRRRDKKTGEIWLAGCLETCAISFLAKGLYFRARESSKFSCADHSTNGYC